MGDNLAPNGLSRGRFRLPAQIIVHETLHLLSIGRTSLYAAVERDDLERVKFGNKTLFYAGDLAAFLTTLWRSSAADTHRSQSGNFIETMLVAPIRPVAATAARPVFSRPPRLRRGSEDSEVTRSQKTSCQIGRAHV